MTLEQATITAPDRDDRKKSTMSQPQSGCTTSTRRHSGQAKTKLQKSVFDGPHARRNAERDEGG